MKTSKTKKIKAWAVICENEIDGYLVEEISENTDIYTHSIFAKKRDAIQFIKYALLERGRVVPCTITYKIK